MTKQEFERLTNQTVTEQLFEEINNTYMACGDYVDKETFCELWANEEYDKLLDIVVLEKKVMDEAYRLATKELDDVRKYQKERDRDFAELLIGKACAYNDTDLHRRATELIGRDAIIAYKLEAGLPIWEEERMYIIGRLRPGLGTEFRNRD